jgi:hypothetical protein
MKLKYIKPIKFKEQNVTYAENQKEYLPLPAFKDKDGQVICCWKLGLLNRLKLLLTGKLWLSLLTFNQPLTPHRFETDKPFKRR